MARDYKLQTTFCCQVTRELAEALGKAHTASVRVPQRVGNFDYDLSPQELKRLALFAKVYLPSTNAPSGITIR
jgi:hypothetical protein